MVHFNTKKANLELVNLKCVTYAQPIPVPSKGIRQDFGNFVNVLWIWSLIHVDLIGERNFETGFIVLSIHPLNFPLKYFFENDSEKKKK